MLRKGDFMTIKALGEQGVYQKDIAKQLGVHPKTVSRALKRGKAPSGGGRVRGSKLDPYKPLVDRLLRDEVWNAIVILREIQAVGYDGGITILRDYIRPKRVLRQGRATVRFETKPGVQLQSDWGEVDGQAVLGEEEAAVGDGGPTMVMRSRPPVMSTCTWLGSASRPTTAWNEAPMRPRSRPGQGLHLSETASTLDPV